MGVVEGERMHDACMRACVCVFVPSAGICENWKRHNDLIFLLPGTARSSIEMNFFFQSKKGM